MAELACTRPTRSAEEEPFNLGSPKQIQTILFEKRQGLPVLAKTPKGQPSTAESVLEELAAERRAACRSSSSSTGP